MTFQLLRNAQPTFRKDENGIVLGIGYVFFEPVVMVVGRGVGEREGGKEGRRERD